MAEKITPEAIEQAPDVTPDDVLDHETILNELAQLSLIAYDQCRRDKAKLLGIRVTALDGEVAKRRPQTAQPEAQGTQVIFETPQLWLLEVQGADLLDELANVYNEHLILLDGGADVLALWTVHTYTYEASNITPRLGITSPLKRCGKTRVLEALSLTCPRVLLSSNATPAAIFRAIDSGGRTRSASENFMVAMTSVRGVPCRHGQTSSITTGHLGADSTRSASLYSDAGRTCRDFDDHGPRLTETGRHVARTAAPDLAEFFPPPIERPAPDPASAAPAE